MKGAGGLQDVVHLKHDGCKVTVGTRGGMTPGRSEGCGTQNRSVICERGGQGLRRTRTGSRAAHWVNVGDAHQKSRANKMQQLPEGELVGVPV